MARPLDWQLKVEDEILDELRKILEQSVSEIEKELAEPLSGGVGEALSRAQAQAIAKAARSHLNEDWPEIRQVLSGARESSADAAVRAFYQQVEEPLKTLLGGNGYDSLVNAQAAMASDRINTVVARLTSSKRSLSEQVWQTRAMTNGWLNSKVNQALARGWDAERLAKEVVSFVNPNVPGGASYAARRLARSEINNAFHAQTIQQMTNSGVVEYARWNLSRSHPDRDICDDLAEHRLGEDIPGQTPKPDKPEWSPTMSREDADRWAEGSAIPEVMLHGTSAAAAESIRKSGFSLDRSKYGRAHGNGVYLTENEATLAMYAHGAELQTRVNVSNPVELMDVWVDTRFGDILEERSEKYFGTAAADEQATAEAITQFMNESNFDALIKRGNDGSIEELVVLDPKNVVVIEQ